MKLNCEHINGAFFEIDTMTNTIIWDTEGYNQEGKLKTFLNGITNEIQSIAGIYNYDEQTKSYSYISPYIHKEDIINCNNYNELEKIYNKII